MVFRFSLLFPPKKLQIKKTVIYSLGVNKNGLQPTVPS
nr:MAG TPA: hypothetical protein [Caudoviricetes sp.]